MNPDILSFYKQCLNLQEASFSRIDHEDAMVAIVFKITQPSGEQLVLKVCDRPNLPQDLIEGCSRYYEKHISLLESVDGPCIVHRDYRPGNLIVENGKLQGIIDWAGARASFAEEDFCSIEHGEWTDDLNFKKAFLAGYEIIRPVPNYARLTSFLRLNKAIATIGFTVKRGTWNNTSARLYQYNRQVFEAILKEK